MTRQGASESEQVVVYLDAGCSGEFECLSESLKNRAVSAGAKLVVFTAYCENEKHKERVSLECSEQPPYTENLERLVSHCQQKGVGATQLVINVGESEEQGWQNDLLILKDDTDSQVIIAAVPIVDENTISKSKDAVITWVQSSHADHLEIWSTTFGLYGLDPRTHEDAPLLAQVAHSEAAELASFQDGIFNTEQWRKLGELNCRTLFLHSKGKTRSIGTIVHQPIERLSRPPTVLAAWVAYQKYRLDVVLRDASSHYLLDQCFQSFKKILDRSSSATLEIADGSNLIIHVNDANSADLLAGEISSSQGVTVKREKVLCVEFLCSEEIWLHQILSSYGSQIGHVVATSSRSVNENITVKSFQILTDLTEKQLRDKLSEIVVSSWQIDARLESCGKQLASSEELEIVNRKSCPVEQHTLELNWWCSEPKMRQLCQIAEESYYPVYVMHLPTITRRAKKIKASVNAVSKWFYAIKANSSPLVIRSLVLSGINLECVSSTEVYYCLNQIDDLNMRNHQTSTTILYIPNFCRVEELEEMLTLQKELKSQKRTTRIEIVFDSPDTLDQVGAMADGSEIALRIDSKVGAGHHAKVVTAGPGQKFGCDFEDVERFCAIAQKRGASIHGIHSHSGSGITDPTIWNRVFANLIHLVETLQAKGYLCDLQWMDLGGGIGVPHDLDHDEVAKCLANDIDGSEARIKAESLDFSQLQAELEPCAAHANKLGIQIWMEPGRYYVSPAGVLLTKVTQSRTKGNRLFIGVTAGMNTLIRPALYGSYHSIVNISRPWSTPTEMATVVGPICESGDVLGVDRVLPETKRGDIIMLTNGGAYGFEMRSFYNMRGPATRIHLFE